MVELYVKSNIGIGKKDQIIKDTKQKQKKYKDNGRLICKKRHILRKKEKQDCESYNVKTDEKQRQSKRQKVAYSQNDRKTRL